MCGATPWRGDTRVKAIKSDNDSDSDEQKKVVSFWEEETRDDTAELATKKGRQVFQEKNRGVTPSVAAPGVTHLSDATAFTEPKLVGVAEKGLISSRAMLVAIFVG